LALPFALKSSGLLLGVGWIVLISIGAAYSARILMKCGAAVGAQTYPQLFNAAFGKRGRLIAEVSLILDGFGSLCGYFIIVGDLIDPWVTETVIGREFGVVLLIAFVMLPLCLLRKIDSLKYTSGMAVVCVLYMTAVISLRGLNSIFVSAPSGKGEIVWWNPSIEMSASIPVISFTFAFHSNIFSMFSEMENSSPQKVTNVIHNGVSLVTLVYLCVAVFGYVQFLSETKGNIVTNFSEDVLMSIGSFALALNIMSSVPIMHFACRTALFQLWLGDARHVDTTTHVLVTVLLVTSAFIISVLIPEISTIFGLVGATVVNLIVYTGPAFVYFVVIPEQKQSSSRIYVYALAAGGIVVGVLGVGVHIVQMIGTGSR